VIARRPQVSQAVEQVQAPVASRRKTGLWIGLGVGILLLFVAAGIGISFLRNKTPSLAASVPTQTYTVIQPSPTAVVEAPAATSIVVVQPVASDTPAPTNTPAPSPKPTITLPSAPTEFKVLWDISHGPRLSQDGSAYTPDGMYKSLVQTLAGDKLIISSGDLTNLDSYDVLVLSGLSAANMPYTSSEADKIEQFIRVSGHGLLLMSDIPGFGNHADVVSRRFSIGLGDSASDGPVSYSNEPFFLGVTSVLYLFQGGVFQVSSPSQTAAVDKGGNSVIAFCECDAGRVMAISDANLWDNRGLSQADNQRFATNVFLWLVKSSP